VPWAVSVDQFGLVQADHGLSEGVVVGISFATNGYGRLGVGGAGRCNESKVLGLLHRSGV
jgi:hypothetical protein